MTVDTGRRKKEKAKIDMEKERENRLFGGQIV